MPVRAQTGVTSSKCLDYQSGFETMQSLLLTAVLGVDVTSQSVGSLENLMTISFEKTIIDNEIVSRVKRIIRGFNTDEEQLCVEAIMDVDHGSDYLMHASTLCNYKEGWQPSISDWNRYETWEKQQPLDIEKKASLKAEEIIREARPLLDSSSARSLKHFIEENE